MRISDWSSDVCSSDLVWRSGVRRSRVRLHRLGPDRHRGARSEASPDAGDRKSVVEGKRVSVRVDLGGRRLSKKKQTEESITQRTQNAEKTFVVACIQKHSEIFTQTDRMKKNNK